MVAKTTFQLGKNRMVILRDGASKDTKRFGFGPKFDGLTLR